MGQDKVKSSFNTFITVCILSVPCFRGLFERNRLFAVLEGALLFEALELLWGQGAHEGINVFGNALDCQLSFASFVLCHFIRL